MIPNPSFEFHMACPNYQGQWYDAVPWDTVPNQWSSPDYFNSCSPTNANPNGQGIPKNLYGFQYPLNGGNAYMGIICYVKGQANDREYICNKLLCPLQNGKIYKAGFFVSKANNSGYAIDQMGLYIGDTIYGNGTYNDPLVSFIPQIKNSTGVFLKDTVNWTEISGSFTANGNEKYIAIGNFATDANTMIKDSVGPLGNNGSYYLIDSVYLIPTSPQIILSSDTTICKGNSVTLQATGSSVYYWFNSANILDTLSNKNSIVVSPSITTTYILHTCCGTPYSVTVQVINPPAIFSLGNDTILCTGNNLTLTAPAGYNYQWSTTASSQQISVSDSSIYWVQISNACGTSSDTIKVSYSQCLGVHNIFSNGEVNIFPNPSNESLTLEFKMQSENMQMQISDLLGRELKSQQITNQKTEIDVSSMKDGIYFLQIKTTDGSFVEKIVIQHSE